MNKIPFRQAIQSGKILVADGAMGTNLMPLGMPKGISGEAFMLEKPEAILTVQRAFAEAGADILLTCTFSGTPIQLEAAGLKGRVGEVSRRAVELAREAGGDAVYVGGSMGPTGQMMKPLGPLAPEAAQAAFAEQARALVDAGVELLVVETQFDLGEAEAAVRGARSVTDLPLVCSFSFDRGVRTMMGVKPAQMAKAVTEWGADLVGINCGRSLEENLKVLVEVRAATTLPIWFKPNAGLPHIEGLAAVYDVTPQMMAACVPDWLAAGAQVVGGCCGTSPAHLAAIAGAAKKN